MDLPRILPEEVLTHNVQGDVWVSVLGRVVDVSDLAAPSGSLAARIVYSYAGKDMSHLFDPETKEVVSYVHPSSGERVAAVLMVPDEPDESSRAVWWLEPSRCMGLLTKRPRPIRILDLFSGLQVLLSVCTEDTVGHILQRYKPYNSDVEMYSCLYNDSPVDLTKTLEENGVQDERDLFVDIGLPEDFYIPALALVRSDLCNQL